MAGTRRRTFRITSSRVYRRTGPPCDLDHVRPVFFEFSFGKHLANRNSAVDWQRLLARAKIGAKDNSASAGYPEMDPEVSRRLANFANIWEEPLRQIRIPSR